MATARLTLNPDPIETPSHSNANWIFIQFQVGTVAAGNSRTIGTTTTKATFQEVHFRLQNLLDYPTFGSIAATVTATSRDDCPASALRPYLVSGIVEGLARQLKIVAVQQVARHCTPLFWSRHRFAEHAQALCVVVYECVYYLGQAAKLAGSWVTLPSGEALEVGEEGFAVPGGWVGGVGGTWGQRGGWEVEWLGGFGSWGGWGRLGKARHGMYATGTVPRTCNCFCRFENDML